MSSSKTIVNIAGYKFVDVDRIPERAEQYKALCEGLNIKGFMLIAPEGVNFNFAAKKEEIDAFMAEFTQDPLFNDFDVKTSQSEKHPFRKLKIRQKGHIIPFSRPVATSGNKAPGVTPLELKKEFEENDNLVILDVRNHYETEVGKFDRSEELGIRYFRYLPEAIEKLTEEQREELRKKDIVTVCTGGIKTEKATRWMLEAGFPKVRQLEGGILKYLEECGSDHFNGRCFVFDNRVSVDGDLQEQEKEEQPADPFVDEVYDEKTKDEIIKEHVE